MSVTSDSTTKVYALAIIAHPDDEAFLLSGTCMKFGEEGKNAAVICATRGEKGTDRLNRNLTREQMAQIREEELKKACTLIDCNCVELFNYPDGELDQVQFQQLVADLAKKIEEYQPKIILTFGREGISGHRDHIAIGAAAQTAAKQATHRAEELWLASMPASIMPKFNEHLNQRKVHHSHFQNKKLVGVPDEQLYTVDIRKFSATKLDALKAHQSQYMPLLTFDIFLEYECFEVLDLKRVS